jgi:hypothetical protein
VQLAEVADSPCVGAASTKGAEGGAAIWRPAARGTGTRACTQDGLGGLNDVEFN